MKAALLLLTIICLVVPAAGQTTEPTGVTDPATDPTVMALTALLPLREQAKFGVYLKDNRKRTKFAEFLNAQGRFALLGNKQALLFIKAEADRPNYGGNAAAKTRKNLWLSILQGEVKPDPNPPAKPND